MKNILLSLLVALFIVGCGNKETDTVNTNVTGVEAREMIAEGAFLLDVRTQEEYLRVVKYCDNVIFENFEPKI